jgi:hypothetical protein
MELGDKKVDVNGVGPPPVHECLQDVLTPEATSSPWTLLKKPKGRQNANEELMLEEHVNEVNVLYARIVPRTTASV